MTERHKRTFLLMWLPIGLLIISGLGFAFSRPMDATGATAGGDLELPPMSVTVWNVGGDVGPLRYEEYRGLVTAARASELAFRRHGIVRKVIVQVGDSVSAGQLLAELDDSDLNAELAAAQARREQSAAALVEAQRGPRMQTIATSKSELERMASLWEQAKATLVREQTLFSKNAGSKQMLDDAKFAVDAAESAKNAAQQRLAELEAGTREEQIEIAKANDAVAAAAYDLAKIQFDFAQIVAPFDGHVSRRFLDEGSIVQPGESVLKVIEDGRLETRIGLPADRASKLRVDQTVEVSVNENPFVGRVIRLEPDLDPATQTRAVEIAILPASDRAAVPGQMAVLRLGREDVDADGAHWIPAASLVQGFRGLWAVYVLGDMPDEVARSQSFATLERADVRVLETDGDWVFVSGNLHRGDRVVASGVHRVGAGMRVQPADASDLAQSTTNP